MSKHTPGRLVLTSQDDYPTGCATFEDPLNTDVVVLYHDNAKADARRLVACWNACEGIPTDALEAAPSVDEVWDELAAQRDELLEATSGMLRAWDVYWQGGRTEADAIEFVLRANQARAAIAKATGEQT